MTRIKTKFGFSTTAAEVLDGVDLTGKTMIVTGGASGIGIETVRALLRAGAAVTIAARRPDAAETVAAELRGSIGNSTIDVRALDIADLASVRRFVSNWARPIHGLINNAGSWHCPSSRATRMDANFNSPPILSATSL
jgi:NAD(P)-dependent dehydrogenase (short-subunit alcohol dehydrogenase family)